MRLLIVDDEQSILVGMRSYFQSVGYDVDCAREKEEAQALVSHVRYDCVIVDLCLTVAHAADGLDIIPLVREGCPGARVVVLTAYGSGGTEAEARRLGADAFLQKPQPLTELGDTIASLVRSSA